MKRYVYKDYKNEMRELVKVNIEESEKYLNEQEILSNIKEDISLSSHVLFYDKAWALVDCVRRADPGVYQYAFKKVRLNFNNIGLSKDFDLDFVITKMAYFILRTLAWQEVEEYFGTDIEEEEE
jgi:hypothetical protein